MTDKELKAEAKKLGYVVAKKPIYQCSCYMPYPNECFKNKNGKWKCVDKYRPIKFDRKGWYVPKTKCVRLNLQESEKI